MIVTASCTNPKIFYHEFRIPLYMLYIIFLIFLNFFAFIFTIFILNYFNSISPFKNLIVFNESLFFLISLSVQNFGSDAWNFFSVTMPSIWMFYFSPDISGTVLSALFWELNHAVLLLPRCFSRLFWIRHSLWNYAALRCLLIFLHELGTQSFVFLFVIK